MRRLEQGDAYVSSQSEGSNDSDDESYDDESYGEIDEARPQTAESNRQQNSPPKTLGDIGDGLKQSEAEIAINADQLNVVNETFNPLRFIAHQLKELNEERKQNK